MSGEIAISGIGITPIDDTALDLSHKELLYRAGSAALEDAGLEVDELAYVCSSAYELYDGRGLPNHFLPDSLGGVNKPADIRVAEDGLYAIGAAAIQILGGGADVVMVGGVQKASEFSSETFTEAQLSMLDPVLSRPLVRSAWEGGDVEFALASLALSAYGHEVAPEDMDAIVAKNVGNARAADAAVDAERREEPVAGSLKRHHRAPFADGACALVLTSAERARGCASEPVWINGFDWASGPRFDIGSLAAVDDPLGTVRRAVTSAYFEAGIDSPRKQLDIAEISDRFAHMEILCYEALELCDAGKGGELLRSGVTERDGELPVNPSGGLLGEGDPINVAGLRRAGWLAHQLRGTAGQHQVDSPETGVVVGADLAPFPWAFAAVMSTRRER